MIWLLLGLLLTVTIYIYLIKPHSYWKNRGIKQRNVPLFFGDSFGLLIKRESLPKLVLDLYNLSSTDKYVGSYQLLSPFLIMRDPELIKQITVKDFDHFQDHPLIPIEYGDPLAGKSLLAISGSKWKDIRTTISPAYTGSKMKTLFLLMKECAQNLVNYFENKSEQELNMLELKSIFMMYANDAFASVAFGVKNNCLEDENNEFFRMGKDIADFSSSFRSFKVIGYLLFPRVMAFFKLHVFPKEASDFFRSLILRTIQLREKNKMTKPDMLQLLMDARKQELKSKEQNTTKEESDIGRKVKRSKPDLTNDDIIAQAQTFFFANFDIVSAALCFTVYELAVNPVIQTKLIAEIDETLESCGGDLTHEALRKMKYLDMIISETLRKWPSTVLTDRMVTNKPYKLPAVRPGAESLVLEVGSRVWIPIMGIHRDPKYYPDPDRFDPERFSKDNKRKITPYTYLPFGTGPRNCIAYRLALLEMKVVIFYILNDFVICTNNKTEIPLTLDKTGLNLNAAHGFWLGLKRRNKNVLK